MIRSYAYQQAVPRPAPARFGARLSPRRKLYAQRLLDFICWHAMKVMFNDEGYRRVADELGLDRFAVNQAVDDLYALGLVHVVMRGEWQVVEALARSIEEAA